MVRPKKQLGQHFLSDRNILEAIAEAAHVGPDDVVIEVGPGTGTLTEVLAERAQRIIAVELDAELVGPLRYRMPPNVEVRQADARQIDIESLLGGCGAYKLLGNLPYYAAMPILRHLLEGACKPSVAVVLLQREVAKEMCASPGAMSLLSVGVQLYGKPRVVRLVRPGSFNPPPKVTSAVVAIDVYERPAHGVEDEPAFFKVVRAGFSAPRKQLRNSLSGGLSLSSSKAERMLSEVGIDPARRAETLSLGEWAALYRTWRGRE